MIIRRLFLFFALCTASLGLSLAQPLEFHCSLVAAGIPGFTGVQSAAAGSIDNKIILFGGRTDGLHRRQPFSAFLPEGSNPMIHVLDPETAQYWSAQIDSLPIGIREQLLGTNLQFIQNGPWLYLIGGYGFAPSAADHITHDKLTAVRLDSLTAAVINGQNPAPWFRQIQDERFAVSGGQIERLGDVYYMVGGQKFEGRYNPMNHPTFTQTYTDEIRRFKINNPGAALSVDFLPAWNDPVNLHRRDYSMAMQVFPDGRLGMTAFSGVFQQFVDLPFLNTVDIDTGGYAVNNNFQHRLNQYHCAHLELFDTSYNRMHTVFFGGIAQFYFGPDGQMVQDDNVPFVRSIGRVTRLADGSMTEAKIGELSGYLGAGAEFIWANSVPLLEGEIANIEAFNTDSVLLGYLIGGIESEQPNIFFNNLELSKAHELVHKVYWVRDQTSSAVKVPSYHPAGRNVQVNPNPAHDVARISYTLSRSAHVDIALQAPDGRLILTEDLGMQQQGEQQFEFRFDNFPHGVYIATLTIDQEMIPVKIAINKN